MNTTHSTFGRIGTKTAALALVATTMLTAPGFEQRAQAQALQPVVDVCTGISLEQSALRDILEGTVVPTAQALENVFNSLFGVAILVPPLLSLNPLQLGIADTTAALASGDPIGLSVLDTNGQLVASGDCNVTADGFTLNTPAGIAIGGNQITGLGQGTAAAAAELDAIAFGNGATTGVGATGAVALGTDASVTAVNGVALGAGSTNDRGPVAAYTAFGVTGPVASAGTVSVGAPGAERQITNVAPGSAPSDAATVGQVQGAITAATADAVQYDDPSQTLVTLDGAGGTTIANVAPGTLAAGSTDAVNGGQLFATNQQVGANTTAIANLDGRVTTNTTNIANLDGRVTTNTTNIANLDGRVTTNTTNIANLDGRVTTNTTDISNLDGRVTTNTTAITDIDGRVTTNTTNLGNLSTSVSNIDARVTDNSTRLTNVESQVANVPVGYVSDADGTTPSATPTDTAAFVSASGGAVTVTNVAAGTLAAGSTDAVNGSQLAATNANVAANRTDIDRNRADIVTISATIGAGSAAPLQYSDAATPRTPNGGTPSQDVTLLGANAAAPVRLHNLAAGVAPTDAVNLGQLQGSVSSLQADIGQALADARAYTDGRFDALRFDLSELREDSQAGTAAAMAMANIPQTMDADRSMVGGSIGHYRGETAFGFGFSTATNDGAMVFKASGTLDTRGRGGVAAGAGFAF